MKALLDIETGNFREEFRMPLRLVSVVCARSIGYTVSRGRVVARPLKLGHACL